MVQNSKLNRVMDAGDLLKNGASLKSHLSKMNNGISIKTYKLLILFILNLFFFPSCEKNEMDNNSDIHDYTVVDVLYTKDSKLKQISYVESVKSKKSGIIISQYEYDDWGRISKVSQPMYENGTPIFENGTIVGLFSYSDYVYNNEGLLEKIINYHSNTYEGFINLETYTYSYDKEGNKLKTLIEYPKINRTDSILYFYDKNRLVRENKYDSGIFYNGSTAYTGLIEYIEYEYDNQGKLVKETNYSGTDNTPYQFSVYYYQNGLNIKTEIFSIKNDLKVREIKRYYDKNGNLIYLESNELVSYSSAMSYVVKYDYY